MGKIFIFISGAVRSGKSAWAEKRALEIASGPLVYLATARVYDQEMRVRVERHQVLRKDKGFLTVECGENLTEVLPNLPYEAPVLLECLGTWTANEMFAPDGSVASVGEIVEKIYGVVCALRERAANLLIVSNDIFSDGVAYEEPTENYRRALGSLHVKLATDADIAVECACGLATPISICSRTQPSPHR